MKALAHTKTIQVTINGNVETFERELSVAELLLHRGLEPIRVAVEVNEDVVPRRTFERATLRDGDRVEIVTFVGGG